MLSSYRVAQKSENTVLDDSVNDDLTPLNFT